MALQTSNALYCNNIGNTSFDCCYANQQDSQICRDIFLSNVPWTQHVCTPHCLANCSDPAFIYGSKLQDDPNDGTGVLPIKRYLGCANVPNLAGYLGQELLEPSIWSQVEGHIPKNASSDSLKKVTYAVSDCLTATCRNSRKPGLCGYTCSGVNLLINGTTPNVAGLNDCMTMLCTGGSDSLPYADADVVGIGVWAAYLMQCIFAVILWFVFFYFWTQKLLNSKELANNENVERSDKEAVMKSDGTKVDATTPQDRFGDFLEDFHKAQCYFSATIQIAALSYGPSGIFDVDMLVTFMLVPLATNGVLPVVFTLVLLYKRERSLKPDVILLTTVCWLLSSVVYWILYSHVVPINSDLITPAQETRAYKQFYYKLTSLDACGGYSALAACPTGTFDVARTGIKRESHKIRILTPVIWSFSTICLLAILAAKYLCISLSEQLNKLMGAGKMSQLSQPDAEANSTPHGPPNTKFTNKEKQKLQTTAKEKSGSQQLITTHNLVYALVTMCFLAGIGMQLSLLSVATSLDMMDRKDWSFGQVVAITVWVPPLLAYLYSELRATKKDDGNLN